MSIFEICQWIQDSSIGTSIRESTYVFPLIEASHVLGLAISVGTIAIVDLRLIGAALTKEPVTDVIEQLQPWTLWRLRRPVRQRWLPLLVGSSPVVPQLQLPGEIRAHLSAGRQCAAVSYHDL